MFLSLLDLLSQVGKLPSRIPAPTPSMELKDQGDALVFHTDLKGIDPRSVQVRLTEISMAISGYGKMEEQVDSPDFYRVQTAVTSFFREVPLIAPIDPQRASAQWAEGETGLTITMPKRFAGGQIGPHMDIRPTRWQ